MSNKINKEKLRHYKHRKIEWVLDFIEKHQKIISAIVVILSFLFVFITCVN